MDSNWRSSPVKKRLPITQHRQELSQQIRDSDAASSTVPDFVVEHLNILPDALLRDIETKLVNPTKKFMSNRQGQESYEMACEILNSISELSCTYLNVREDDKLVFIDHHSSALTHHPDPETSATPDIGVIFLSRLEVIPKEYLAPKTKSHTRKKKKKIVPHQVYYRLPWHLFESLVELKPIQDAEGPSQVAAYAGFLNQARPDKPGVYCIRVSPKGYHVVWSDPSGLSSSNAFVWEDIAPLAAYVFSLYNPPKDHIKVDASITLDESSDIVCPPRWTVQFRGETYPSCRVLFVGSPWTRQSWIAISDDSAAIIKDQYHARGRRYDEGRIFDILQEENSDEPAPGCVHVQCHGDVDGVFTANTESRRQKKRIVMTTIGKPLYDCPSVFEFLKAMYDTLEGHRWIFETKCILHRDISINNILLPTMPTAISGGKGRPKFIDEILNPTIVGAASCALLCDFDSGCVCKPRQPTGLASSVTTSDAGTVVDGEFDGVKRVAGELKNRTGTPAFIARSVALGKLLWPPILPPFMPTLEGDIKKVYESTYNHDTLRKYEDSNGQRHGGQLMDDKATSQMASTKGCLKKHFFHQPCHDAESVFWVIVAFLLRIHPVGARKGSTSGAVAGGEHSEIINPGRNDDGNAMGGVVGDDVEKDEDDTGEAGTEDDNIKDREVANPALNALWKPLAEHDIGNGNDGRASIFTTDHEMWEAALHPRLAFLAPMLTQLASQVQPEYKFIRPSPPMLHLHEAMQRILLRTIWSMREADHIQLSGKFQMVTINRVVLRFQPLTGTKHSRPDGEELQEGKGKKPRRT